MQSTGQTSTQALSLTLMQGSAITYAIPASLLTRYSGKDLRFGPRPSANPHILINWYDECQAGDARLSGRPATASLTAYNVRSFGSSASRSESPKRLKAKTARLI